MAVMLIERQRKTSSRNWCTVLFFVSFVSIFAGGVLLFLLNYLACVLYRKKMSTSSKDKLSVGSQYQARSGVMYFYFKNTGFPSGEFSTTVRGYGNALLNSKGGFLVFGVQENGRVSGQNISRNQEDLFRLSLDRELRNFTPAVSPNLYRLSVVKVGHMSHIMEVRISAGPIGEMYQNQYEEVYIVKNRKIVGPLWPQELKALIIQKYKEELQATKGILSP